MRDNFRVIGGEPGGCRSEVEFELKGAGTSSRVFIRASEPVLEANNEAFTACSLVPAMVSGVGIEPAGPLSARLASALPTIVDILRAWIPGLSRVSFPSLTAVATRRSSPGRVGAFFSGGVDSFHTFLENRDQITDLVFVHGFDISLENTELRDLAAASIDAVASEFGVGVVHVETNIKPMMQSFTHFSMTHGAALATIGHLLAPAFERLYIASSVHYADLFPWGTHPLLDSLWSSEGLEFVHHGSASRRIEKVEFIAGFDAVLSNLRVCHEGHFGGGTAFNCDRCDKCVRTMVSLEAAGKLSQCTSFHRPLNSESVAALSARDETRAFFVENLEALRTRGIRPDLQRALEGCLRGPAWLKQARRRRAARTLRRMRRRGQSGAPEQ